MNVDFSRPILAIDTSPSSLPLAIFAKEQMWTFHEAVGTKQSTLILPTLDRLLADAGLARSDIASIVYAQGPGAFTGLRIGLGVAQGLALAQNLPMIGIPCLEAVASLQPNSVYNQTTNAYWPPPMRAWARCFTRGLTRKPTAA